MNKYPRLISWEYHDATLKNKENLIEVYILNELGEDEIKDGTLTNYKKIVNKPNKYFNVITREGFTLKARNCKQMYFKMKEKYTDLENKIRQYKGNLKDCGSYIYMNISYINASPTTSFYMKNEECFLGSPNYVKKEHFTIQFIEKILNYTPYSWTGTEIEDFKKYEIPKLLLALKLKFPEIHDKLSIKSDADVRSNFLHHYEKLKNLKPGKVGKIKGHQIFMPSLWEYDGEYLKTTKNENGLEVEYRIKADDSIEVEIVDINTIDLDKIQ